MGLFPPMLVPSIVVLFVYARTQHMYMIVGRFLYGCWYVYAPPVATLQAALLESISTGKTKKGAASANAARSRNKDKAKQQAVEVGLRQVKIDKQFFLDQAIGPRAYISNLDHLFVLFGVCAASFVVEELTVQIKSAGPASFQPCMYLVALPALGYALSELFFISFRLRPSASSSTNSLERNFVLVVMFLAFCMSWFVILADRDEATNFVVPFRVDLSLTRAAHHMVDWAYAELNRTAADPAAKMSTAMRLAFGMQSVLPVMCAVISAAFLLPALRYGRALAQIAADFNANEKSTKKSAEMFGLVLDFMLSLLLCVSFSKPVAAHMAALLPGVQHSDHVLRFVLGAASFLIRVIMTRTHFQAHLDSAFSYIKSAFDKVQQRDVVSVPVPGSGEPKQQERAAKSGASAFKRSNAPDQIALSAATQLYTNVVSTNVFSLGAVVLYMAPTYVQMLLLLLATRHSNVLFCSASGVSIASTGNWATTAQSVFGMLYMWSVFAWTQFSILGVIYGKAMQTFG